MAREIPYIQALGEAVHGEMARDDSVIYFGQNLGLTDEDPYVQAFGNDRVRVTPISETAEIGMAVGAAFAGLRPVVQLYMSEFMLVAMDQVVNEAPRFYGMSGGEVKVPLVLQAGYGFTAGWAGQHTGTKLVRSAVPDQFAAFGRIAFGQQNIQRHGHKRWIAEVRLAIGKRELERLEHDMHEFRLGQLRGIEASEQRQGL